MVRSLRDHQGAAGSSCRHRLDAVHYQTTLSVPALTGAISAWCRHRQQRLVISFARERYAELGDPRAAALEAGFVRIRPVMMTALAMIIGMLPMALGLGEGG